MSDFEAILKTEYSAAFDEHRKKAMINSFYKYGPAKKNYGEYKCMDAIKNLEIRLQKYKETGNTEYLVRCSKFRHVRVYASFHSRSEIHTDGYVTCEIAGFGVNQLEV